METRPLNAFPDNLKRLRTERGWSQLHLGELAGVSRTAIWQYEEGTAFPRKKTLEALSRALGVPLLELIDEQRPKSTMTYAEVVLLSNYRKLNDEGKAMLEKQAAIMVASGYYGA